MSFAFIVTRPACWAAIHASVAIFSAISKSDSLRALTAETETLSAPPSLASFSRGAKGNSRTITPQNNSIKVIGGENI